MKNLITITNPLVRDMYKGYGGTAQVIYDECCQIFGWHIDKRKYFGKQRSLYAEKATPEGYSPLFLAHNNWTETTGGDWFNKIYGSFIEELWFEQQISLYHDETARVTFAKTRWGEYVFLGVYVPIKVEEKIAQDNIYDSKGKLRKKAGDKIWIKTYQLKAEAYPQ